MGHQSVLPAAPLVAGHRRRVAAAQAAQAARKQLLRYHGPVENFDWRLRRHPTAGASALSAAAT